jgi:hypothetical protein
VAVSKGTQIDDFVPLGEGSRECGARKLGVQLGRRDNCRCVLGTPPLAALLGR